jgi:hypothetical protein
MPVGCFQSYEKYVGYYSDRIVGLLGHLLQVEFACEKIILRCSNYMLITHLHNLGMMVFRKCRKLIDKLN